MEGVGILGDHTTEDADNQARGRCLLSAFKQSKVSAQLVGWAQFLSREKSSFFVAGAGPALVKHLQTALAHAPTLAEKIPQEN